MASQPLSPGGWNSPNKYSFSTDGYAYMTITGPSSASDNSVAWGALAIDNWIYVTGGNTGSFGVAWSYFMYSNNQTATLFVPAGRTVFVMAQQNTDQQQANANVSAWFTPVTGASVEAVEPKETKAPPSAPVPQLIGKSKG